ncbi:cytochrome P450 [Streptomyces sp. NPDC006733]|uniref:cytochrome P450 family protein n=1 Tax=Streptomyces sp. NPDC006733 TaxID=3155460 RepID=UPI0033D34952
MTTSATQPGCPYRLDATGADIHGEGTTLRALGPAARVLLPGDIPAWSVTDPNLIRRLLAHPDVSKDAYRHWPAYRDGRVPPTWPLRIWVDVRNALTAYGAEHTRLRAPLADALTPRRVRALTPQITTITHELLDELGTHSRPGHAVDLRARFAWRLPLLVVNAVLGVPDHLHDAFRDAIGALFATALTEQQAQAAYAEIYRLLNELVDAKTKTPADDVTHALITHREAGTLSDQELLDSLLLLIGAGHETTVNLLDHAVVNLLTHPEQLERARAGQTTAWDQVVEETLRHQAPVATIILRYPTRDIDDEATGLTFQQGDAIAINYAAAGRDPATHGPNAHRFDTSRTTARDHLAFGHGTHFCPGAPLARLEARIALPALFAAYPRLQLAVEPDDLQPLPSLISNGHQQVPVWLHSSAALTA